MNENFNNLKLKTSNERCIGNCTDYRDKSIFELFSCSVLHFEHLIMDDILGISEDENGAQYFHAILQFMLIASFALIYIVLVYYC